MPASVRCAVYDLIVDDETVYVGSSSNPKRRLAEHKSRRPELREARLRIYAWYRSRLSAEVGEMQRVRKLRPRLNVHLNPDVIEGRLAEKRAQIMAEWAEECASGNSEKANSRCHRRLKAVARQTIYNHFPPHQRERLARIGPKRRRKK